VTLSNDVDRRGLDLGRQQGEYDLVVMPLRLVDGDGGPARAALRRR
jgi:kynurenine formamidase